MCASKDGFPLALITLFGQMLAVESLFCMGPGVVPVHGGMSVCMGGNSESSGSPQVFRNRCGLLDSYRNFISGSARWENQHDLVRWEKGTPSVRQQVDKTPQHLYTCLLASNNR